MRPTRAFTICALACALPSCAPKDRVEVRAAEPVPPPKLTVPAFLLECPPLPEALKDQCA